MDSFSPKNISSIGNSHINWTNPIFICSILALGIIAITGNLFILFIIGKSKTLRNNVCNLLIGILAMSDSACGIGLTTRGVIELVFQLNKYDFTKLDCLALGTMGLFGVHMSQLITALIAHDRLRAVQDPFEYAAKCNVKRMIKTLIASVIYSIIGTAVAYIGIDFDAHPVICATGTSIHKQYRNYWAIFAILIAVIVLLCYIRTSILLKEKLATITGSRENRELRMQETVFKTITIILFFYALFWCLPHLIIIIVMFMGLGEPYLIGLFSSTLAVCSGINSGVNVFIYAWKHHEIGDHMRRFIGLNQRSDTFVVQVGEQDHPLLVQGANMITTDVILTDCQRIDATRF